jgi:hypothetical protein
MDQSASLSWLVGVNARWRRSMHVNARRRSRLMHVNARRRRSVYMDVRWRRSVHVDTRWGSRLMDMNARGRWASDVNTRRGRSMHVDTRRGGGMLHTNARGRRVTLHLDVGRGGSAQLNARRRRALGRNETRRVRGGARWGIGRHLLARRRVRWRACWHGRRTVSGDARGRVRRGGWSVVLGVDCSGRAKYPRHAEQQFGERFHG